MKNKATGCLLILVLCAPLLSVGVSAQTNSKSVEKVVIQDVKNTELQTYLENSVLQFTQTQDHANLTKLFKTYPMEPLVEKSSDTHLVYKFVGVPSTVNGLPLTNEQLYSIDFDQAAGITGRAYCYLDEMKNAFPGLHVERALVDIYFPDTKGFKIYSEDNENPVYSASCTLTPTINVESLQHKKGEWGEETPHERIFAVVAHDKRVVGPYNSRVGVTTYSEVKNKNWEFEGRVGCVPSLAPGDNDIYCINDKIRMIFDVSDEYQGSFEDTPPDVIDQAVLKELLYWPGF